MIIKPKRRVATVYLHCTASDDPKLVGGALVDAVWKWHVKERGFNCIGYHYLIDKLGNVMGARSLELQPAAQIGYNQGSIAICSHGAKDFTEIELDATRRLCYQLWVVYEGLLTFHGHREVNPHKTCPVYDYKALLNLDNEGRIRTSREQVIADAGEPGAFGVAVRTGAGDKAEQA